MVSFNGQGGSGRKVTGKGLFEVGTVIGDEVSAKIMRKHGLNPLILVAMHASGIWGEIDDEARALNELGARTGGPVLSLYKFGADSIVIATNVNHEATLITGEIG